MVLDGAGWPQTGVLKLPGNLRFLRLPPYSPELNPVGHCGNGLCEKWLHNRVFASIDALEGHLCAALRVLEQDPTHARSIGAWSWIINSLRK